MYDKLQSVMDQVGTSTSRWCHFVESLSTKGGGERLVGGGWDEEG